MLTSARALLLCSLLATPLVAQQTPTLITPQTPVTSLTLQQWLQSKDPRLIAWAGYFVQQNHDPATLAQIPELLGNMNMPPQQIRNLEQHNNERAIASLLSALINSNTVVPVKTISAIDERFPEVAAILVTRLPMQEAATILHGWTYGATGTWHGRQLARIAAMLLAKEPTKQFVQEVVEASEEDLTISIHKQGNAPRYGALGGVCGDSLGSERPEGWPETIEYLMEENNSYTDPNLIVELDEDRINYRAYDPNRGFGSCDGVQPLNADTRYKLISHWLGGGLPWHAEENDQIIWTSLPDYQLQLGKIIATHHEKLRNTSRLLVEKGLLARQQDPVEPKLVVTITCDITPCPLP